MDIQKDTRRRILNDLCELGNLSGQLEASEFVRKVFPDAETMPSEDSRFNSFIKEVWKHMEMNDDWTLEYLLLQRLKLLDVDKDKFIYFLEQIVSPGIIRTKWNEEELQREAVDNRLYVDTINEYLTGDG